MKGRQVGKRLSEDVIRLIRIASDVAALRYGTKALSTRLLVSITHTIDMESRLDRRQKDIRPIE